MSRDTIFQIITVVAIVVGPILALWMQRILDGFEKSKGESWLYSVTC